MRRLAALVMFVGMLALFVVVVTRTKEHRIDRGTATVLVVTVECPCVGECEAHAKVAFDLEPEYAEAESCVLKLPTRHVVGQRSDTQWDGQISTVVVVDSRLISTNAYDIVDHGSRSCNAHDVVGNRERGVTSVLKLPRRGGRSNVNTILGNRTYDASAASTRKGHFSVGVL